ncbi:DASS family sodium-coupled anion symporter [Roseivirga sp. BDSF3-8]|uniref:SLC13 family permease n=1 Tax=Roseivirga sp. BDSF3-8 TaxID=3241598 RepID=UPI0035325BB3
MQLPSIRQTGFVMGPLSFFIILFAAGSGQNNLTDVFPVLALAAWMVVWWITEAAPIPVTALLPIIILPLLQVSPVVEAAAPYASPIIFLFMGGFMIALALEKHNLHKRVALNLLRLTGTSGNGIILGFMISTAILSMWISNTATAVMMLPIALSVVGLVVGENTPLNKSQQNFALALMLSIAYSANIGGTMTLIGTPPNVVMAGYLRTLTQHELGFGEYLAVGIPVGVLLLTITYLLMARVLFPNKLTAVPGSGKLVSKQLAELGSISREEYLVIGIFLLTATGWIFKQQLNALFGQDLLTDHVTAMIGGSLMFIVPSQLKSFDRLLDWEDTQRLPWGILILFGGGMSLAKAMEKTGLIELVGDFVAQQGNTSLLLLVPLMTVLVLFLTEVMSNVALITIFVPVAIGICRGLGIDPLLIVVPATLASSCAFMMPISTPPNAIVFASGHIRMKDMIKTGIWLNLLAAGVLSLAGLTIVRWFLV